MVRCGRPEGHHLRAWASNPLRPPTDEATVLLSHYSLRDGCLDGASVKSSLVETSSKADYWVSSISSLAKDRGYNQSFCLSMNIISVISQSGLHIVEKRKAPATLFDCEIPPPSLPVCHQGTLNILDILAIPIVPLVYVVLLLSQCIF